MALKHVLSQRRHEPLTPLIANRWEKDLVDNKLLPQYPKIPSYIRLGAHAGIPRLTQSYTPLNHVSIETLKEVFNTTIQVEFSKGRYIGPFSKEDLEREIGPFQSSPLSLIPKPAKPGKFRLVQNLSHPHTNLPIPSINARLNSDDFPCTWGTFKTTCTLIRSLPPGAEAATRDIAEAYRIIPLHEDQWPGVVVRISNQPDLFAVNTSNSFGCATAGGLFGMFGDALADLLRANGIGPLLKWVDDFLFIRVPTASLPEYNKTRAANRDIITKNGGKMKSRGRLWFKGRASDETGIEQFAEDCKFPLKSLSVYSKAGTTYPYDFKEISAVTDPLGIPWESSKDVPFSPVILFAGFEWNLGTKKVALPDPKKVKYLGAITEWRQRDKHTLEDTRKLYGRLLYTCHIIPQGRAYLTNFEKLMGTLFERPFTPRHQPKPLEEDLAWWQKILTRPSLSRDIPGGQLIIDVRGFSDASSSVGLGVVIGSRWRAWRLLPDWKERGRDIGWAEAVALELLIRIILKLNPPSGFKVFCDNIGVVEGWWTGRSRNSETNWVFRRIHGLLEEHGSSLTTRYVNTVNNPADGPSRGIFPPHHLLLPSLVLPPELEHVIVDFDAPIRLSEQNSPRSLLPEPKPVLSQGEQLRRAQANRFADDQSESPMQDSTFGQRAN